MEVIFQVSGRLLHQVFEPSHHLLVLCLQNSIAGIMQSFEALIQKENFQPMAGHNEKHAWAWRAHIIKHKYDFVSTLRESRLHPTLHLCWPACVAQVQGSQYQEKLVMTRRLFQN